MLTDAHCHPYDLSAAFAEYDNERKSLNVLAAASACGMEEFEFNEILSRNNGGQDAQLLPCFGIHPQIFKIKSDKSDDGGLMAFLDRLASEKRISAIGECGFDLFNEAFRETESIQERYFVSELETAVKYDLPLVIHVRRAMHKIFLYKKKLSMCKAVIFHSWSGTYEEALSLLRAGVNAYFSFGNTIMLNHKQAIRNCAMLPADRILTETDAPFQPRRGKSFSSWTDLPMILNAAAKLRTESGNLISPGDLETMIEINFREIFNYFQLQTILN